jgi:hypothetical protein
VHTQFCHIVVLGPQTWPSVGSELCSADSEQSSVLRFNCLCSCHIFKYAVRCARDGKDIWVKGRKKIDVGNEVIER